MAKISHTVQAIDAKQAALWLELKYKHQRAINPYTLQLLVNAMADGTFSPVNSIMFSVLNGRSSLINGQHTLTAIVRSGKPQTMPVVFYEVEDGEEEAMLYFRIDRQRRRNFADSIRSTAICDELRITPTQAKETAGALRFAKGNFGVKRSYGMLVSDDEMLQWIKEWAWEIKAIHACITPCGSYERRLVLSVPVYSVALITMRYQPDKAREFWRQVAQGDGLERGDPRKTLREWLMSLKGQTQRFGEIPKYTMTRCCIAAWNNWFIGKEMKMMSTRVKLGPVKIAGTSYSGNQADDFLPLYPSPNIERARLADGADRSFLVPSNPD
jgi:hypothetical protein